MEITYETVQQRDQWKAVYLLSGVEGLNVDDHDDDNNQPWLNNAWNPQRKR